MRELTTPEINRLSSHKGVRQVAVRNFLRTVTNNSSEYIALLNLDKDAKSYRWNSATVRAIRAGINIAFGGV